MPGVIERVVENWLTSSNERSYQIPFCQLLAAEGETVVYISSHGPFEQGKDVVTLDKKGRVRAYQLKCGDFGLAEWRKHKGEITDLVELPIQHPAIRAARHHTSFLVTNGDIKDPALKAINSANDAWHKRHYPALRTISGSELLDRFLAVNGTYLPQELSDLTVFLELVLRNGREPTDKGKLSKLLESILQLANPAKNKKTTLTRSISSAVLITGYTLEQPYRSDNHWAIFESWVIAASYVLAAASKARLAEKEWVPSFDLCELGALNALSNLCADCEAREHLVEGDAWTDGHVYHARVTLLVGLLCAYSLHHRTKGTKCPQGEFINRFLHKNLSSIKMWGESAVPYFVMAALEMESLGEQVAGESVLINVCKTVLDVNGAQDGRLGLPSPYYSAEEALRFVYGLDQVPLREDFVGATYTIHPLIDFLVRRWRRQTLRSLWYAITGNSLNAFYPTEKWEWFRWRAEAGTLTSRFLGRPQSWVELLEEVERVDVSVLPERLRKRASFAVLFALVYPHRFTREMLKLIETALI